MNASLDRKPWLQDCPLYVQDVVMSYTNSNITIGILRIPVDLQEGQHAHESYEFLFPLSEMIYNKVEKNIICAEKNKVFPFNPWQYHGPGKFMPGVNFSSIMIEKAWMNELCHAIFRKTDVVFENANYYLDRNIYPLIRYFIKEIKARQPGYELALQSISTQLVLYILRGIKHNMLDITERNDKSGRTEINRVTDFLQEEYRKGISLDELSRIANLSPYHLIRVFKKQTGKTPVEYLIDIKIENAKRMILEGKNITEVCYLSGFNNQSYFSSVFKRKVSMTPSQYREQLFN
ncbi:MAG: hypothetical protein CVU87_13045 [Firmicutes bacterium HGW-Firmicutes-12]|jgi:AraC-like DNA-binding protein|nr:MAG: hypothetical protein CVU87_13045 [Firmicutes bacterium HGW-Firmicutes-12]